MIEYLREKFADYSIIQNSIILSFIKKYDRIR